MNSRFTILIFFAISATAKLATAQLAFPAPTLPAFGPAVYDVTVPNSAINGGVPASTASSDNSAALSAYIAYCSSHGGGTVEVPAGTYLSNGFDLQSNVNLQIDTGATLRDINYRNTLIGSVGGSSSNIEISGGGIIDGNATTSTGSAKLVNLTGINNLEVTGVSIENAGNEHLVAEKDTNVTINGVTIADPGTLAANKGNYLNNTDGIDYWGSNFLIENCNINDGDDNIVAKTASGPCSAITITNDTIGAGHGISVGGGSAHGLNGMVVTNCTMNGTEFGLRFKAQDASGSDAGGGAANPVQNVYFNNITMANVLYPIEIDSFYNGNENSPANPNDASKYPATPVATDATTPFWENINFDNVSDYGAYYAGLIYGVNATTPNINGLYFSNVNISAYSSMQMWYAANVDLSGLNIQVPYYDPFANATPVNGLWEYNVTGVPEPATLTLGLLILTPLLFRRPWTYGRATE